MALTKEDTGELLPNVHPGEILAEDFLVPMAMTAADLEAKMGVEPSVIEEFATGKRPATEDLDRRLREIFGMSEGWWLRLQEAYDIEEEERACVRSSNAPNSR